MDDPTEFGNRPYPHENIQADISATLGKLRQQFPERFPKPVYVLEAVDDSVDGQWEQRLLQAKEYQAGERIILIPYNVRDSYWIGVIIKFKTNEQIERAEFIDPVKDSALVHDKLKKEFAKVYPSDIIQSKSFQKQDDKEKSATLTVENLIKAAEQAQLIDGKSTVIDHSPIQPSDNLNTNPHLTEDKPNVSSSSVPTGNISELLDSKQTPSNELDKLENQEASDSRVKVPRTESKVEQYGDCDTNKDTDKKEQYLRKSEALQNMKREICRPRSDDSTYEENDPSKLESYEVLKEKLENGLAQHDISDKGDLEQFITEKKQVIQTLKNEGKLNLAKKRQNSLSELEQLQLLVDKIEAIESCHSTDDYEIFKKKLEDGLAEHDIISKEDLKQRIGKKIEEIHSPDNERKHSLVRKRKQSLSELEQLQLLFDQIEAIKPSHSTVHIIEPKEPLNIEHPIDHQLELSVTDNVVDINILKEEECLIREESLKNMYQDFYSMPFCAERSIITLLFYVSLKLAGKTMTLYSSIKVPDQIETEMKKELECLKERMKIEELQYERIQNTIEYCFINLKDEKWKDLLNVLRRLLQQISPLNIRELLRLIEKIDDAAELIKDKEIILFLGMSGSGISTTIHFLSGSTMVEQEVNGFYHIAPTAIRNAELNKITTSPFAESETRYITPVTVNFEDVGGYSNGSIILCDTPGFVDTSGPEVAIANAFGIGKAIKICKSVRPVVLISYKGLGYRGDGVKGIAHTLVGLIPGITDHMKTFSYIFTKFPPNEKERIHALLKDINDNLNEEEKSDIGFKTVLIDMVQKTRRGAQVLDPINDDPGEILDELAESTAIHHPEAAFQCSITEMSKSVVREQVRKHQLDIMSATKRSEYKFVEYKLDQLKYLNDLLHQDYIEQIYNDCVRYISKHLSEDYQEGISALNRSFMNQTVLSNEDIEQYQTRTKRAENLRNKHLGKEAIHSSAFIQYLNQQVDIVLKYLRDKDVDDLSTKLDLDKIKLLSNSFSDVDCKYINACQCLAGKFEDVVKSFKSSVLSNKFDQSANDIAKLYKALTVLHDHLDGQDMKTKYTELKEYFLKYLDDSTENLSHIFSQEKLEESDVDSLNNCVCILENANNTFAFRPHISKEATEKTYEQFLSKIMNYVEAIVKKINTQFKNENSFHVLEQYMKELDLIRTIPIIQFRTTQSYCSTLEKLVGYIQESRRDVEELLRTLFRREGKVNYDKLRKCLSSLKSAKWIENYRTGVYSDVINNVEEQMTEHVKELNESVVKVNLDLDNYDKIEPTYKIISEINEMKHVENLVPNIVEHITAVNSWFVSVTNNVFLIIKDTFSIEKWKEQGYQTLDFQKAEKAFYYLDACNKIPLLFKNDRTSALNCKSVLNGLEEFIRYFSSFVENEMENCFENIKQYENTNKEDMFEKARVLASRLHDISEIKATYPRVFSYFANKKIIEKWQNELAFYLTEISDEMGKLSAIQRTEALSIKLLVVKALSKLDGFLDGEKYIDIYHKYQNLFFSQTNDICKQVIGAIKNTDYERVSFEMAALQSSTEVGQHFFNQAKRALTFGLDNLMEETKNQAIMLGNNIEIDGIKSIVENLRRMQRAKQFVSQLLDKPDEIDNCIVEVKKLVEDRIKRFIESVNAFITINNFYEADKKIDSITLVRTLLGNFCTEDVFRQIEALKEHQNDVVSNDVVKKYSDMNISGYTLNPPTDIFAKFGEVNNTNPIYNQALNIIKENILAKFRKELDEAKSKQPPSLESIHIRNFESAVKYLPDAMRIALEVELKHCKDDIVLLIRDNENNLDTTFNSGDLKSMKKVLQGYQKSGMQSYLNKGRELVLKQVQSIVLKINQNLEQNNIIGALDNVKTLYDYKSELNDVVSEIGQRYLEVGVRIKNIFQEAYFCFTNRFLNTNISYVTNEIIETVEKSFIYLIEFMKFENEYKGQRILTDILPENFSAKISELNGKILQYFSESQKKYKDALQKLDVISLKDCLDTANQWNSLFIKMKSYDNMHKINDTSVNNTVKVITELTLYPQMLQSVSQKIEELRGEFMGQQLINSDTTEHSKKRDEFYRKINEKLIILNKVKLFDAYDININVNKIEQECSELLIRKIAEHISIAENFAKKFSADSNFIQKDYDNFNMCYCNLLSIRQEIKVQNCGVTKSIETIEKIVFDKIRTWENAIKTETPLENVATSLINMKRASNSIPSFNIRIDERIDKSINSYKTMTKGSTAFGKLCIILNRDTTGIGESIICEHKVSQSSVCPSCAKSAQRHGIDYILEKVTDDFLDKNHLKRKYDEFRIIYEGLVKQYLKPYIKSDKLISNIQLIAGDIKQMSDHIQWDATIRDKVPKLTAHVFALWTLKKANHFYEAQGLTDQENYLLQPHAAQVISIFRMLGIGDKKEELKNNLVQIGTGEGKSIILGATASLLALLGFDVYCACYSEYLSQRDYTAFLSLFDTLNLLNYIRYGTINKLCEDIINENGDIRQTIEQLISKGSNNAMQNNQCVKRAKILLIDEVDVFFNRDFYGNVYTPSASLRDPTITSLVNLIWTQRQIKPRLTLNKLKAEAAYIACCNRFPQWEPLIQEAMKDMLSDVNNFESHDYVVKEDKIGYVEQDNVVYNIVYGYKTLFAYHYEQEKGNISKESLEENICIQIKCGSFSYAEIPLEFRYIMGVTGTLQTLSDPEKKIIQNVYKVTKNTFMPSIFGRNNLKFTEKDDIMIENSEDYFNVIRREIDDRLKGKSEKCAVLVFFESKKKLKEFYDSKALESIKESVVYLTEEASSVEKESIIKRATTSGQITLFTKTFGRGTDFIYHDQSVAANGGTHVIQTFLSEEVSEEVQIKGRTARQGDYGSYSMVLLDQQLDKFHIEREHIEDFKKGKGVLIRLAGALNLTKIYDTIYDLLNDKRTDLFKIQYEANMTYVEQAKKRHDTGQTFLSCLYSGKIDLVRELLVEENKGVEGVLSSRTVCLMDATGSMVHLLHKCKNTVDIMFERASKILTDNRISSDSFQIQFAVYRNYNSQEDKILQSSPWETKPDNLRAFMNSIEVEGGWGNEAVEIGLWHANKENERENITQVILIGDAPPNSKHEVEKKREKYGENYWKGTKFAQTTYYEDELAKLTSNKIPVHAFFVEQRAQESFEAIAQSTGGRCAMLDINSFSGSKMLTDLVTEEILRNVGGRSKGDALVDAYRRTYT